MGVEGSIESGRADPARCRRAGSAHQRDSLSPGRELRLIVAPISPHDPAMAPDRLASQPNRTPHQRFTPRSPASQAPSRE
jgi:hypothetical protein